MEIALILAREVLVMFLLIFTGMLCRKKGMLDEEFGRTLCNVLLVVVIPAMLIRSFQTEKTAGVMRGFWLTFLVTVLFHALSIAIATLLLRDKGDGDTRYRVERIAAVFSNGGFVGLPLIMAAVGQDGMLYAAVFVGVFNVVNWLWSVPTLAGTWKALNPRAIFLNPAVIGFSIGAALFFLEITVPTPLFSFMTQLNNLNTPGCMIALGVFLSFVKFRDIVTDPAVYKVTFLHNLLVPAITLFLLWATGICSLLLDGRIFAQVIMIMASCSAATTAMLMAARYGCDSSHGAKLVAASTFASIVTMPFMLYLTELVLF